MTLLSPFLILLKLGVVPNWRAKEIVISYFFNGDTLDEFQEKADKFSQSKIPSMVRSNALNTLKQHQEKEHLVVIVSASAENWLGKWATDKNVDLIGTRLEVIDNKITGRLLGKNCYGPEKVTRLKQRYNLDEFDEIYAYGDSRGDRELMKIATHPFYKVF